MLDSIAYAGFVAQHLAFLGLGSILVPMYKKKKVADKKHRKNKGKKIASLRNR
jgi:hypothetical protein